MINNNRQQGRRRGRGGQRQGGGGGGQNNSRIDSRARGNAPQLLEKYKNLAADAQRMGDRVQTEYYLQFADHYFRVVSEQRSRFEEQNQQRRDRQDGDDDDAEFEGGDFVAEGDDRGERQPRRERFRRDRDDREDGREEDAGDAVIASEGDPIEAGEQQRPRRQRQPRREPARDDGRSEPTTAAAARADTFDANLLPPSFAPANDGGDDEGEPAEAKPRRRRLRPLGEAGQA